MKKDALHKLLIRLLAVILLSSVFFTGLYKFNNKYTYGSKQPVDGLLTITEEDYSEIPLRFLCNGWAYYPDVLLTPESLEEGAGDLYMQYVNIGEHIHFDSLSRKVSPFGSGTYVLRLKLPSETHTYGIELPEIFSAYKLYINGKLALQMGDPEPDTYQPQTQLRMVTFDAADYATLILSVSNYSSLNSGLIYVPVLGNPLDINILRGIRLGMSVIACTLSFVAALLSLYMSFKTYHKKTFILALLCITLFLYTSFPLLHALLALPIFPWCGLELTCGCLILLFVLVLHNRICDVNPKTARFSIICTTFFCILSLLYSLSASKLNVTIMDIFSHLILLSKTIISSYFLVTSWLSIRERDSDTTPMFYASAAYLTAFICELLLPSFEPIIGGRVSEFGSMFLIFAVLYILSRDFAHAYTFNLALTEEHRQLARQIAIQQAHYQKLKEKIEDSIKWRHDERHHLKMLFSFLENGELDRMRDYLMDYKLSYDNTEKTVLCQNLPLDAILQYYKGLCRQAQIKFTVNANVPPQIHVSDTDLSILCGNLVENAYEACRRQTAPAPYIDIKAGCRNGSLLLRIENSYDVPIQIRKGKYLSAKHEGYGIGTASAEALTKSYNGQIKFDVTDSVFRVSVILGEKKHD